MSEKCKAEYLERLEISKKTFSNLSNPWNDWFQSTNAIIEDSGDNVNRCGQCGWEIISEICDRCNTYYPEYTAGDGDNVIDSSEGEDIIDVRFSGTDGENDFSESGSDANGFVVNDNYIEYESGDGSLSDREVLASGRHEQKIIRGNVIEETDDETSE
jgi:hypothetical protein